MLTHNISNLNTSGCIEPVGAGIAGYGKKVANVPFHSFVLNFDVFYCFSAIKSPVHSGLVKIGKASFSLEGNVAKYSGKEIGIIPDINNIDSHSLIDIAKIAATERIKQYTNTVGIKADIHWVEISRIKNMTDNSIHKILEKKGFSHHDFGNGSTAEEWYPVSPDHAREAFITASKGSHKESFYLSKVLRPEQERFLLNTKNAYLKSIFIANSSKHRLWDAKMRFGKTMTAMELIKRIWEENPSSINRVHIITHRPNGVEENWRESFQSIFRKTNWQYATKSDYVLPGDTDINSMPFQNQKYVVSRYGFDKINRSAPFIYFSSMQDMRGKDKNKEDFDFKSSNNKIYDEEWDLVIVDEAQEGNTTELALQVHDSLKRKFTILLSGTPYKYLETGEFQEDEIDSWDYVMEQEAKEDWNQKINLGLTSDPNPYRNPKMWIQAIDMRDITTTAYIESSDSGFDNYFDFNTMFRTETIDNSEHFVEKEAVIAFLDNISRSNNSESYDSNFDNSHMPYSSARLESTTHALWVLPSVASCKALQNLMKNHDFFNTYEIVNVAGNDKEAQNASDTVAKAIFNNPKTITLTVGRMTVGATVKEWTAVLMLCNTSSASAYMQTIFRVQSPYDQQIVVNNQVIIKSKTDAFVWDFAPDRVLRVFSDVSEVTVKAREKSTTNAETNLKKLLNFLPIISYIQNGDMKVLNASDIMRELKRVYSQRVVSNGFESPFLFVRDYTKLPDDFRDALENIRSSSIGSMPTLRTTQGESKVVISQTGLDKKSDPELQEFSEEYKEISKKRDLSDEEKEEYERVKKEISQRRNITFLLNTISVRIPYLVLALNADINFKNELLKYNFQFENLINQIDDESWFEVFGFVNKKDVIKVIPAFDEVVLHSAIINLLEELEAAIILMDSDYEEYANRIVSIIGRLRNPNKETVMTPYNIVEVAYKAVGLDSSTDFALAISKSENKTPTFFDINVKSGLFPFYAALNIKKVSSANLKLSEIADKHIFCNSRTPVGKMITATLLGKDKDWGNISVIDVLEEKKKLEDEGITDSYAKELLIGFFLKLPMISKVYNNSVITTREEGIEYMKKNLEDLDKNGEVSSDVKKTLLADTTFDFVVSNPPYQTRISENNPTSNSPIWPDFLYIAVKIGKKVSMINPARWQKGASGTGLVSVRKWIMGQKSFVKVINLKGEVFPTASIEGGVAIEVFDHSNNSAPVLVSWDSLNGFGAEKNLIINDLIDVLVTEEDEKIISKIIPMFKNSLEEKILGFGDIIKTVKPSSRTGKKFEYRLKSNRPIIDNNYLLPSINDKDIEWGTIFYRNETKEVEKAFLPISEFQSNDSFDKIKKSYKVAFPTTRAYSIYRNSVLTLKPNEFTTQSFIGVLFDSEIEANNFISYMKTYFFRYLSNVRSVTQSAYANVYKWVPDISNVTNPRTGEIGWSSNWTDDDLAIIFKRDDGSGLTKDDWKYIKSEAIKSDKGKGDYEGTSGVKFTFNDGSTINSLTFKDINGKDIF